MRRSSGSIGSVGTSGSVQTEILINSKAERKQDAVKTVVCSPISDQELYSGIVTMNSKSLTFTIRHAESIEYLNVIHSNVSPALSSHQTFDHHLEKKSQSEFLATFS